MLTPAPVSPDKITASDWSSVSYAVKKRDGSRCRITNWSVGFATAHLIPQASKYYSVSLFSMTNRRLYQMLNNEMFLYQRTETRVTHLDSGNLLAMQHTLRFLFDASYFAIVPKDNGMVVYFLRQPDEASALYHNQKVGRMDLTVQYLYARFAWTVFKLACEAVPADVQALFEGDGHDGERDNGREEIGNDDDEGGSDNDGSSGGGGGGESRIIKRAGDDISCTLKKIRKVSGEHTAVDCEHYGYEEKDLALARKRFPFFLPEGGEATPWQYNELKWYPGKHHADQLREAYLESHPNIRACSDFGTRVVPDGDALEPTGSGVLSEDEDEDAGGQRRPQ
ncbi:hypothetical protein BOTBODRAFT_141949 [Botryobasidium botryosum FD-172 SS1]|uniref:HNH nuclease domain-containing protein n=1 Tax=Botryobasidium botryosum (strain FD-172 SS1) TaxID=930990 RepID=A0A067N1Q2_BOTB1|nr:hypothetical protein BOTBODRAFT_141949 [Botryobasidium botryosum FD-172 SS1]